MEHRLLASFLLSGVSVAQTPAPNQEPTILVPAAAARFEVASIKRAMPGGMPWEATRKLTLSATGRLDIRYISVMDILTVVFGVEPFQVAGPDWLRTQSFDISAIAPAGAQRAQIPLLLQELLVDRFKLQFHEGTQASLVYALVIAESGAKVKPAVPDDSPDNFGPIGVATTTSGPNGRQTTASARAFFGVYKLTSANGVLHYEFPNISLSGLAQFLTPRSGRGPLDLPVVDRTNLDGAYNMFLEMLVSEVHGLGLPASGQGDGDGTTEPPRDLIRSSLAKQGIRLLRRSAPMKKIIIDHIEKIPTPN